MATYKNVSNTTKTFHGVTFKPGDIKECPGIINHSQFIRVKSVPKEPPKQAENKPKSAPAKSESKPEPKSKQKVEAEVTTKSAEVDEPRADEELLELSNKEE